MEDSQETRKSKTDLLSELATLTPVAPGPIQDLMLSVTSAKHNAKPLDSIVESVTQENFEMDTGSMATAAGQSLAGANMNFFIGLSAEMLPNNGDVWYPVKILDMDTEEREVLCHYENSASRCDEWVCVDSCRIRPITVVSQVEEKTETEFQINQKVMATWSDNRKFPAVVKSVLPDGSYEVLFMDGFRKTLKPNKLTKFTRKDQEHFQKNYPNPIPAPPSFVANVPFGSELTSKEERRKLKRKLNVKDLFSDHRKRHKSEDGVVMKKSTKDSPNDSPLKLILKRKKADVANVLNTNVEKSRPTEEHIIYVSGASPAHDGANADARKRKRFKNRKADYDYETAPSYSIRKPATENPGSLSPKPQAFCIDASSPRQVEPYVRIPELVIDEKLPAGWKKYAVLKKCGSKFDVYIQSPEGRKCRSRSDIQAIYKEKGEAYPMDDFDFVVLGSKRRKRKKKIHDEEHQQSHTWKKLPPKIEGSQEKDCALVALDAPPPTLVPTPVTPVASIDPARRIKTLLPKSKQVDATLETPATPAPSLISTPISSAGESGGTANSTGAGYTCPIQNCGKLFRKENLLMMHVKHYHAEYNQILGSTPNVADLAYARTIGQSIEEVSPSTSFLDKLKGLELQKAAASRSPGPGSAPQSPLAPSPSRKRPENEVSEERIPIAEEKKIVPPQPGRVSEPCQSAKVPSTDSPSPQVKEPVFSNLEPSVSTASASEPDVERLCVNSVVKKQVPAFESFPKRRRFSKYGRNSMDGDNVSVKSGQKRTTSTSKSSTVSDYNESSLDASESGTESSSLVVPKLEQLKKEEVINCTCGYKEEDGLMIQCDLCLCWQHGMCNSIDSEDEVPEKYICYICLNPYRQRSSRQYTYNQDWLKEGTLPKFSFRLRNVPEVAHRESLLKRSHSVTATLVQLESVLHSLQAKINVAEKADHPKLYLWSKPWNDDKLNREEKIKQEIKEEPEPEVDEATASVSGNILGPEPEAPIDPIECRQRLLDHIDGYQNQIESRLTSLEAQIAALESQDPDLASDETPDFYPQTKQTIQMVMKDLQTMRRIATLS